MKFLVTVTQVVEVDLRATRFTAKFMREFRGSVYPFWRIEDHAKHLGQLKARGLDRDYIEGYGSCASMGIKLRMVSQDDDVRRAP